MRDDTVRVNYAGMARLAILSAGIGFVLAQYHATAIVVIPVSILVGLFYPEKLMVSK